jgi:hypothetical protein
VDPVRKVGIFVSKEGYCVSRVRSGFTFDPRVRGVREAFPDTHLKRGSFSVQIKTVKKNG